MANVKPNPTHSYKAQLLDYDALLLASDNECSYCLSEREVQIMLAFVDYIAWQTRYIATETEIDRNLIQKWSDNLARKLMTGCCNDGQLHRFTEQGVYQSSDDGGATWADDPTGDPRNDTSVRRRSQVIHQTANAALLLTTFKRCLSSTGTT